MEILIIIISHGWDSPQTMISISLYPHLYHLLPQIWLQIWLQIKLQKQNFSTIYESCL